MLGLQPHAYAYDDLYVTGLTSFFCFVLNFVLMLMLTCKLGLKPGAHERSKRK